MPNPIIGGGILSLGGAAVQAGAANNAAKAQGNAAKQQVALQKEIYGEQTAKFQPFLGAGTDALSMYLYDIGALPDAPMIGGTAPQVQTVQQPGQMPAGMESGIPGRDGIRAMQAGNGQTVYQVGGQTFATMAEAQAWANANRTGGTQYGGIQLSPGARFAMEQGRDAIEAGAAGRGNLFSGSTVGGLERMRFGLSAQDREQQLSRLAGLVDMGMGAAGMHATAGGNYAAGASNALANLGNAKAAGAVGVGNAITGGLNNLAGVWGYMQPNISPQAQQTGPGSWIL